MQLRSTVAFAGAILCSVSTSVVFAQSVQRAPVTPRYFWRGLGTPAGAMARSWVTSVSPDGRLIMGIQVGATTSGIFATEPWGVGRIPIQPPSGVGAPLSIAACDNAALMSGVWNSGVPFVTARTAIASGGGAWTIINDLLQPSFSNLSVGSMSADGTVFQTGVIDNATNTFKDFVYFNGNLIDINAALSASLGITVLNAIVTDVAAYRRVCVGGCRLNGVAPRAFSYDLVAQTATILPNVIGGFTEPWDASVSGDGIVTTVTWVDFFTTQSAAVRHIDNGNGVTSQILLPLGPASSPGRFVPNETGHVIAGDDPASGAVLWTDGIPTTITSLTVSAASPPAFLSLGGVSDMSAFDVVVGTGLNTAGRMEGWIARVPSKRIRSDFNRDGICQQQQDLFEFNSSFAAGNLAADWDYDTVLTPIDQALFNADWSACR